MKRFFQIFILAAFISLSTFAQVDKGAFLSGSLGGYSSGSENKLRPRNAPSIVFSTGFGLPLYKQVFLYTRLSYISRSNYTAQEFSSIINSDFSITNKLIQANASFSQLLFNGGLQYNIYLTKDITLGLSSGITYALVNHKATLPNGVLLQRLDNEGVYGVFSGVSLEKSFEESNAAIFGEAQYNYAKKDVIYFRNKFSGMNFTFGARYYFN